MLAYAGSSFLVSCYVSDGNTRQARNWFAQNSVPLAFTALHRLEIGNALRLGVFRGMLSIADSNAAWRNLQTDCGWAGWFGFV